ncbi:hypothetical protein D3C84_1180620 [compost metagenome]
MARGDDRDRVAAIGGAYRAHRAGVADLPGDVAIAAGFAERYRQQRGPHLALELGTGKIQRQLEALAFASEVLAKLPRGVQ